jgi:LacI family gluconate utilization system Gnt-I transcriptional repressor
MPPTFDDVVRIGAPASQIEAVGAVARQPVGIGEVAKQAGVATTTVTRVLREPEKVAPATRDRVLAVVERTGYAANPHARALRSGRSDLVACFVSDILSQSFGLMVQGCAEVLEPRGYHLVIGQTAYSYRKETALIRSVMATRPAAVMFTGIVELEENRHFLRALGIPVMETWAYPMDPIDMLVGFSNHDLGFHAAAELARAGHRRVAFAGRGTGRGMLRLKGFRRGAQVHGLDIVSEISLQANPTAAMGAEIVRDLLTSSTAPRGLFCASDLLMLGAAHALRAQGSGALPIDLVGSGDPMMSPVLADGAVVIGPDSRALGLRAGEVLLGRLGGGSGEPVRQAVPLLLGRAPCRTEPLGSVRA